MKLKQRVREKGARGAAGGDAQIPAGGRGGGAVGADGRKHKPRTRTFLTLLKQFWGLLDGHRPLLIAALVFLAFSTLLGLVPLYGTKIVFDGVLRDRPMPLRLPAWIHLPQNRHQLLTVVALGMVALAGASETFSLWSRWQATRMTKRVQVSVRKRVFEHAVRLPLHRVYELKSGGVASTAEKVSATVDITHFY